MPYEFEPHERVENILYAIKAYDGLLADWSANDAMREVYVDEIRRLGEMLRTFLAMIEVKP